MKQKTKLTILKKIKEIAGLTTSIMFIMLSALSWIASMTYFNSYVEGVTIARGMYNWFQIFLVAGIVYGTVHAIIKIKEKKNETDKKTTTTTKK